MSEGCSQHLAVLGLDFGQRLHDRAMRCSKRSEGSVFKGKGGGKPALCLHRARNMLAERFVAVEVHCCVVAVIIGDM